MSELKELQIPIYMRKLRPRERRELLRVLTMVYNSAMSAISRAFVCGDGMDESFMLSCADLKKWTQLCS